MNEDILVSVVMPAYNCEKFIGASIDSVLEQTYQNWELIIVDDFSTDRTKDIITQYALRDKRIKVICNECNSGVAVTRNNGINAASGKCIALLDSDDIWEKAKIEKQIDLYRKGNDIVYCSYDFIDERGKSIKRPFIVPVKTNFNKMLSCNVISCSTALIDSDLLRKHKFSNAFYHEDLTLWLELLKEQEEAVGDKEVLMHYRQVTGSRSNSKINSAKCRWEIYRKKLGLSVWKSSVVFAQYAIRGVIKYYLI